jgi:transposase
MRLCTSADARRAARQPRSRRLTDALKTFFEHQLARLSGGSDTAKIIRYGLRHWDGLIRFLDDGRIELDTNIVERSMRPQALTRKNALRASGIYASQLFRGRRQLCEPVQIGHVRA